jgi:hypothetical protein
VIGADDHPVAVVEAAARVVEAEVEAVKAELQLRLERRVLVHRVGAGRHGLEDVAGAEREDGPAVGWRAAVEPELVVPVGQGYFIGGEAEDRARVAVAGGDRRGRVDERNRLADQAAGLQEVGVHVDQLLTGARVRGAPIDDAAGVAAVEDRGAARVELHLLDEVGVDDAWAVEQVVEHRHPGAVEQEPGRARGRAAHDGEREE